ncbi:T9SS type A sorting domain-containing protein [Myroides odoratus]|uniref:T9SS type A sorting domain-containing protein n=3 Tax=Myroides odoratus TaxID=256 RepID=A0A9Q6ZDV8_MYROD|nr:T9SS type A sorting domain-containing protein [Myroides odoratus]QQU00876.1 T9SS type A sorting domain-containing protein [Myroides odoratus]WQD56877.1 T9SS type A sorting domain-containing protein [Myroides odoratus]STZ30826.1 Por secretion system C-terminal sorting domain [Myroides odoratus]
MKQKLLHKILYSPIAGCILLLLLPFSSLAQDYNWKWAFKGGAHKGGYGVRYRDEQIHDIKVGTDNNYYFLATIAGKLEANLNNVPLSVYNHSPTVGGGSNDILLFSTTCEGEIRWSQIIGGGTEDYSFNLVLDQQNNVYIAANVTNDYITADGSPVHFSPTDSIPYPDHNLNPQNQDGFKTSYLAKYNSEGNFIKKVALQGPVNYYTFPSNTYNLTLTENNQLHFIVGFRQGTHLDGHVNIEPYEGLYFNNYLAQYDLDLNYIHSVKLPIAPETDLLSIASYLKFIHDKANHQYLISAVRGGAVGDVKALNYGGKDFVERTFILAIDDQTGAEKWRREFRSPPEPQYPYPSANSIFNMVLDEDSNIYIAGRLSSRETESVQILDPTNPSIPPFSYTPGVNGSIPMIAKLNSQGTVQWMQATTALNEDAGAPGPTEAKGIAINGNEVALATQATNEFWGNFEIKRTFGHRSDPILVRFDKQTGQVLAVNEIPGSEGSNHSLTAVAADQDGNYIVGGFFLGNLFWSNDLGINPIITTGEADFFVAKLEANPCGSGNLSTEKFNKPTFSVYPNPTKGIVYIDTQELLNQYFVYDLAGKQVLYGNFTSDNKFNLETLQKGIYLVKITTTNGKYETVKIVKK